MKARTLLMTGALLALSASAAQASMRSALPAKHALTAHHKVVVKKPSTGHPTKQPLFIYVAPSGQPASVDNSPSPDPSMICPDGNTLEEDCGICNPAT